MDEKNRGVKKSHQTKNLKFANIVTILNCPTYYLAVFTKNKKPDITVVSKFKSKI